MTPTTKTAPSPMPCVLALDDDPAVRDVIGHILTRAHIRPILASMWTEAVEALTSGGVDLMLLDLQMPHVDGKALLAWLRERDMDLPVVVVSAHLDSALVEEFKTLGVESFIWKPFGVNDLLLEVVARLPKREPPGSVATPPADAAPAPPAPRLAVAPVEEQTPRQSSRRRRLRRHVRKERRRRTLSYILMVAALCALLPAAAIGVGRLITLVLDAVDRPAATPSLTPADLERLQTVPVRRP